MLEAMPSFVLSVSSVNSGSSANKVDSGEITTPPLVSKPESRSSLNSVVTWASVVTSRVFASVAAINSPPPAT